ncbi:hypothetical protein HYR65_03175, partial [Candidatus Azambacteria bacterium]|nr:hypothetical protein [Candidatus Azambacteria bacterium]
ARPRATINILFADEFQKKFKKLPPEIQRLYYTQEKLFRQNWRDPRLHTKKLIDYPLPFSFRITRRYRVFFIFVDGATALFATVGHRKDSYK